ncbi:MAG: cupin [Cyanobacteria bacterium]|nr:cupin [Cyanobacteriota bacterium]MEB3269097.1 cupin [Leptolyngbya sp.]
MADQTWLITDEGEQRPLALETVAEPQQVYRLYRFLTELEDILAAETDDVARLAAIAPRVRKLLVSSYWLQMEYQEPDPKTGWSVKFLYREHQFPLTVQMVAWQPGTCSTIHNHATWGLVALIGGQEKNRFWRRSPTPDHPHRLEPTGERVLAPGDIITFTPGAIHQVEPWGEEPTISFNLYGVTQRDQRYQYDVANQTARQF